MTVQTLSRPFLRLTSGRLFANLERAFASLAAAQRAAHEYERLSGRSDASLAADGLTRAHIARVVFEHYID